MPADMGATSDFATRAEVARELEALCMPRAPLHIEAEHATWRTQLVRGTDPRDARYTASRVRLHHELIQTFLASQQNIATDGLAAVVTAGPPAVGKSTRLDRLGYDDTWRRIDSDAFKTMLIEHDLKNGLLQYPPGLGSRVLADGKGIMPLELSGLYHRESTVVADKAQQASMRARENIIIEGTLSWSELPRQIVGDLTSYEYERLDVMLVEAPLHVVLEQSLQRWWKDRVNSDALGGRFTPESSITPLFRADGLTVCVQNARDLERLAQHHGLQARLLR